MINEDEFIRCMKRRWKYYGNTISEELVEAWKTILSSFNDQLSGTKGLLTCDAVCGTGKTLSLEQACGLLGKHHREVGALIVVRLTSQCDELMENINKAAGKKIAISYHTGQSTDTRKNRVSIHEKWAWDDAGVRKVRQQIHNAQVVVITHKCYLSAVSSNKTQFKNWKHGERKLRVCDESLDLVDRQTISMTEMLELQHTLRSHVDYFGKIEDKYFNEMKLLDQAICRVGRMHKKDWGFHDSLFDDVVRGLDGPVLLAALTDLIETSPSSKWTNYRPPTKQDELEDHLTQWKEDLKEKISTFDRIIRFRHFITVDNYEELESRDAGRRSISRGTFMLPENFDSLVILDATSNIYLLYEYLGASCKKYAVRRDVRNFRNGYLNIIPSKRLGKGKTLENIKTRIPQLLEWANEHFAPTEIVDPEGNLNKQYKKVIFAGTKDFLKSLEEALKSSNYEFTDKRTIEDSITLANIDFCHYGAIDGRNDWKEYDNLVICSLQYLPKTYNPISKQAAKQVNPSVDEMDNTDIASSAIASILVQLICRIALRLVIDKNGNCPHCNVYIMLPGDKPRSSEQDYELFLNPLGSYLLKSIKESLYNITIKNWDSFKGYDDGGNENGRNLTTSFICWCEELKPGESRNLKEFHQVMNTPKNEILSFNSMLTPPKGNEKPRRPYQYLQTRGYQVERRQGKGTTITNPQKVKHEKMY